MTNTYLVATATRALDVSSPAMSLSALLEHDVAYFIWRSEALIGTVLTVLAPSPHESFSRGPQFTRVQHSDLAPLALRCASQGCLRSFHAFLGEESIEQFARRMHVAQCGASLATYFKAKMPRRRFRMPATYLDFLTAYEPLQPRGYSSAQLDAVQKPDAFSADQLAALDLAGEQGACIAAVQRAERLQSITRRLHRDVRFISAAARTRLLPKQPGYGNMVEGEAWLSIGFRGDKGDQLLAK